MFIVRAGTEYVLCVSRSEAKEAVNDLAADLRFNGYRVNPRKPVNRMNPGQKITAAVARAGVKTITIQVERTL